MSTVVATVNDFLGGVIGSGERAATSKIFLYYLSAASVSVRLLIFK